MRSIRELCGLSFRPQLIFHFSFLIFHLLFYLALLLFILIPIGFGFGLAVYLKRKYDNPPPRPEANEAAAAENILDIVNESSVAQDILMAKNKVPEEEIPEEISQDHSAPFPEQQAIEPQSDPAFTELVAENQDELLARVLESFQEFSPEEPGEEATEKPVEKPAAETPKEVPPRITKSTFENIPVYGAVPEELLETHLCLDQEILPDAPPEVYDSFAAVPDSLLNRFEVDSPPGAERFVQTQDAAIAIRARRKEGRGEKGEESAS